MEMVSGGFGNGDLPSGHWEDDWAARDPLVNSQRQGGAGYEGDTQFGGTGGYVGGGDLLFAAELMGSSGATWARIIHDLRENKDDDNESNCGEEVDACYDGE